jgi:hypothetical protein
VKNPTLFVMIAISANLVALADTGLYTATLAQPLKEKMEVIDANHNAWRCEGSTCVLVSHTESAGEIWSCKQLVRRAGTVIAYGLAGSQFDAKRLAACNGHG